MSISTKTKAKAKDKQKILLVDDEIDITLSLKLFLEENGFEVETYNNPSLAIANYNLAYIIY